MIEFEIADHKLKRGMQVVEVREEGEILCTIYPEESGIKIISGHFKGIREEKAPYPPVIHIEFEAENVG